MSLFPWAGLTAEEDAALRGLLEVTADALEHVKEQGPPGLRNFVAVDFGPQDRVLAWGTRSSVRTCSPSLDYVPRGVWR